jgi:hypothetical protein
VAIDILFFFAIIPLGIHSPTPSRGGKMSAAVVRKNAFFKAYFLRRKRKGLIPQKALLATAHKLIRVIFAMLSYRAYFHAKMA